jgi:hypothetical protein
MPCGISIPCKLRSSEHNPLEPLLEIAAMHHQMNFNKIKIDQRPMK